jgi:hypothetical protein
MSSPSRRLVARTGLAWLVWLALLLPFAQSAAAWHAYSHTAAAAANRDDGNAAAHAAHCDLCLVAAAAGGPALPGTAPVLPASSATPALLAQDRVAAPATLAVLAYRSRAPPPSSR